MRTFLSIAFLLVATTVSTGINAHAFDNPFYDADEAGEAGIEIMRQGDFEKGLGLIRLAIQMDPRGIEWRMRYAEILSQRATAYIKQGYRKEGKKYFRQIVDEYLKSASILKQNGADESASSVLVQVGDIFSNIYRNRQRAFGYYSKALEFNPRNQAAQARINQLKN